MKKLFKFLSMSSLLLLISCSTTNIKNPDKGKKVDHISFKYMNPSKSVEEIELNNSLSFDEVYDKLKFVYIEMAQENGSFAYKKYKYNEETFLGNNIIYEDYKLTNNFKTKNKIEEEYDNYFKRTNGEYSGYNIEFYHKDNYIKNSSLSFDSYKENNYSYKENGFAGTEYSSSSEYKTDSCNYVINKNKNNIISKNKNDKENNESSIYKYVNASSSIDDIHKSYYGYDEEGNKHSYSLATFVNTSYIFDYNIQNLFYNNEFKELYDNSFILTDKYIILKIKSKYTSFMYDDAINQLKLETNQSSFDTSAIINKLKKLSSDYYTNTYRETEIWIDYSNPYDISDVSVKKLTYGYFKEEEKNNIKRKIIYDVRYLDYYYPSLDNDFAASLIGVEATEEYKSYRIEEIAINHNSYNNKIKNMNKKCKKNNIFDKIVMQELKKIGTIKI